MLSSAYRFFANAAGQSMMGEAPKRSAIAGVGRLVLTIGNKGGVGKSTVAVNTALALAKKGNKVGIFDANIYSPDIPKIMGTLNKMIMPDKNHNYLPITVGGIQEVSVGNVIGKKDSLGWKAPYVGAVLGDFIKKAYWKDLDYLIVDTPPGTGDIHMALCTLFKADGAIVVTTPDSLSYMDTCRSIDMLNSMPLPVIGVVENKGPRQCKTCQKISPRNPVAAADTLVKNYKVEKICAIPNIPEIVDACDSGNPAYTSVNNEEMKKCFDQIAEQIMKKLPKRTPEIPTVVPETPPPEPADFKD